MNLLEKNVAELERLNNVINKITYWGPNAESLQRDYDNLLKYVNGYQRLSAEGLYFYTVDELRDLVEGIEMQECRATMEVHDFEELCKDTSTSWWSKASELDLIERLLSN